MLEEEGKKRCRHLEAPSSCSEGSAWRGGQGGLGMGKVDGEGRETFTSYTYSVQSSPTVNRTDSSKVRARRVMGAAWASECS